MTFGQKDSALWGAGGASHWRTLISLTVTLMGSALDGLERRGLIRAVQ